MVWKHHVDGDLYKMRRERLVASVKEGFKEQSAVILLIADFEQHGPFRFIQESSFYYFTGIEEPGAVCLIDLDENTTTLFVPNFGKEREKWVDGVISADTTDPLDVGLSKIAYLGAPIKGYQLYPYFGPDEYQQLLFCLQAVTAQKKKIFTTYSSAVFGYAQQRFVLDRFLHWHPELAGALVDISSNIAQLRRCKDTQELHLLQQAIHITCQAHKKVIAAVHQDALESDLEAVIEHTFISHGAVRAFPSIVATGKNGAVLHYGANNAHLQDGDAVVVDIGARYGYYCADITRTYPVGGTFTPLQRKIYDLVLETQSYIASIAKPGMWLSCKDYPDRSLNHLAKKFLKEKGFGDYFIHGIGHFLGLDVHDVGDYAHPLAPGDVITIEPGIYLAHEHFGVRIEDNYLITDTGATCLSEDLPKSADEIEALCHEKSA